MMNKKEKKPGQNQSPQQEWKPALPLRILRAVWMVVFTAAKVVLGTVATVAFVMVICGFVFVGTLGNYLQEDIIPFAEMNLDNYDLDQTSHIYYQDKDGSIKELQQIYTTTDREWASYDELPEDLIHAAVAIEDKRFYEHQGVDWITTSKACVNMFFGGSSQFGGSTITQQLIKNLTQEDGVTVQRKVLEIFRAQQFERRYDKEVILEWYFNTIYLGQNCWGVKTAAATYFGKTLEELTTAECASLISITNNPSLFDPYGDEFEYDGQMTTGAERNRMRQVNVLGEMLTQGWITREEYDEAMNQEMVFKYGIDDENEEFKCTNDVCGFIGKRSDFREKDDVYHCPVCDSVAKSNKSEVYSWFVDTVLEDVARVFAAKMNMKWNDATAETCMELIKRGGYHIYATIDMDVQKQVDKIYQDLSQIPEARSKQQLQSAITVINNETGDIVATAGGVGEKLYFDAYNRADAPLQPGSAFKPLAVYSPAFELGVISPATVIRDLPLSYDGGAFPRNDSYDYDYAYTIWQGVTSSINAVAANTLDLIGTQYGFDFARDKFRISTLTESYVYDDGTEISDINYAPLALGALTEGATVREMSTAYATFANHGTFREARTFTKVYDSEGNLVIDNKQESEKILSDKSVNYMNYCLQNGVEQGTGYAAELPNVAVAGKTGSTSSYRDRWFCGFTGYYTAAVWCGYDMPEEIHLLDDYRNPAARLWKKVMEPLHEDKENIPLYDRSVMGAAQICLDSGKLATDACRNDIRTIMGLVDRTQTVRAYPEDLPGSSCDKHVMVDYCVTGNGVATEYCPKFEGVKIEQRALVKMTQSEIDELLRAEGVGLVNEYLIDDYIYLVTSGGGDGSFKGLHGNINAGIDAPYKVCTVHTKEAWEALHQKPEKPTKPTKPEKPEKPEKPTEPAETENTTETEKPDNNGMIFPPFF